MPLKRIAAPFLSLATICNALAPASDLFVRISLAKMFLATAAVGIVMRAPPTMGDVGAVSHAVNAIVASPAGMAIQAVCPIVLLIGLFSRGAALLLLIQVFLLNAPAATPAFQLALTALLGQVLVFGPGSLSVDALFRHGLVTSAIPGAKRITMICAALEQSIGPPFRLLVRLWIAATVLDLAAPTLLPLPQERLSWLPPIPLTAAVSPGFAVILALCLFSGLATRAAACVLLVASLVFPSAAPFDERLASLLVLASLFVHGPCRFSLDQSLNRVARHAGLTVRFAGNDRPHVVIVGGGFGGIAAARGLHATACRVTLVDRQNHHLFQPLLYQVATAGLSPADIATPIRSLFRRQKNVTVRLAEVDGVRPDLGEIRLGGERMRYDYLVLATGAQHSYFGQDDWAASAPGLKTIAHAVEIRRRLLTAFERAEAADDPALRAAWTTFVIVGGGPTGVELAGAIAELAHHGLDDEFRIVQPDMAKVVLLHAGPRLLPSFAPFLSNDAEAALRELGVEVRLGARVQHIDERGVTVGDENLPARTVLWAAGVAASPAGRWLGAATDAAGRLVVEDDLSVPLHRNIFAVGDLSASTAWNGKPVPGLAPAAKQGGAYAAAVIRSRIAGRPAPAPFRYRHVGSLATIGRRAAVVELGALRVRGAVAWWLWGGAHILFLAGGRNRATVMLQWLWAYLTFGRGTRLITETHSAR